MPLPSVSADHKRVRYYRYHWWHVPMCQWDCSWLPISRRETSRRCTRPQTPTLSCIIFTCHSSYPMFYNWWLRLRSCLCLEQASSRNQICHITSHYLFSDVDWKLIFPIAFNSCKV